MKESLIKTLEDEIERARQNKEEFLHTSLGKYFCGKMDAYQQALHFICTFDLIKDMEARTDYSSEGESANG